MAFRMDMHVHTAETSPCGKVPAADVVALYKQRGYDGIVITDHYFNKFFKDKTLLTWREQMDLYLAGYRAAKAAGDALGLMVLQGMELRFKGASDDFLVYGVDEAFLMDYPRLHLLDLPTVRQIALQHKLMIVQAHPFRSPCRRANPRLLDGSEVFNGNMRHANYNIIARNWAKRNNLLMFSASDAHVRADIGTAAMVFPRAPRDMADLLGMIRAKTFKRNMGQ